MKWWRRVLVCLPILYGLGLVWGYFRLPLAAVKSLGSYRSIASAPAVSFGNLNVSSSQRWYLGHAFNESPVLGVPSVAVSVEWNALAVARVRSSYYSSPKGAERRESVYLCMFGAWIPVHNFQRVVTYLWPRAESVVASAMHTTARLVCGCPEPWPAPAGSRPG